MSDLARWNVHGPVRSLRTEFAEWDVAAEEWRPFRHSTLTRFRPDGQIDTTEHDNSESSASRTTSFHDADGRLSRITAIAPDGTEHVCESWTYDADGNGTKTSFVPELSPNTDFLFSIEPDQTYYSAKGAKSMTTIYGPAGPVEAIIRDAEDQILRRVVIHRDDVGRKLREDQLLSETDPFAKFLAPDGALTSTTYAYDADGRLAERRTLTGPAGDSRTTLRYDDHGNRVEETNEDISRELEMDDEGNINTLKERSHRQHTRYEYVYDDRGNYIERIVWGRLEPNPNFQRSNIERRTIEYY
jgi:YD repeat-containing protein